MPAFDHRQPERMGWLEKTGADLRQTRADKRFNLIDRDRIAGGRSFSMAGRSAAVDPEQCQVEGHAIVLQVRQVVCRLM